MASVTKVLALTGAVSLVGLSAMANDTAADSRIRELEAKVASLEARQTQGSKEMASAIESVLRDAERRSQVMAAGDVGAGYDNGFYIKGGEGFVFRPGAQWQFRSVTNYRADVPDPDGGTNDRWDSGYEIRRMRFDFGGTIFTKDIQYFFQWEAGREGGSVTLLEAWVRNMFSDDWGVRSGQVKNLVSHEYIMSSKNGLAADTSLVGNLIGGGTLGYQQGVELVYGNYGAKNPINASALFHDGGNSQNTNFTKHTWDWGAAARVEWKVMGDWKDYKDFTAKNTKETLLVIGGGMDWSQSGDGDQITGSVDAQFEHQCGFGAFGAIFVQYQDDGLLGTDDDVTNWGFLIQGSYLLNPAWELFARWDGTKYDYDVIDDEDFFHEITVGVNYYLGKDGSALHRAKLTFDLTWLPNGSPSKQDGLGILGGNGGEEEWVLRTQFQLCL